MFTFADSFDMYATLNDIGVGYWDSFTTSTALLNTTGRFAGSQCIGVNTSGVYGFKNSSSNDPVHHVVCAFIQQVALSSNVLGMYLQLGDGTTGQCCIVFRSDGAIVLTSGTPAGTTLATYTGAFGANAWTAYEFEVVIHPSAGSFTVRKNGNTSNDFTASGLNTRPGTNTYANRLTLGMQSVTTPLNASNSHKIDDILWRSDPTSVAWMGDIRCYARMPASDASVQFARSPSPAVVSQTVAPSGGSVSKAANLGIMAAFTAAYSGTISSGTVSVSIGGTGNMKAAIYDSTRTIVLATSNAVVNPAAGNIPITFGTPLTVTKGTVYHLAVDQDTTIVYNVTGSTQYSFTTTYASFPAANPSLVTTSPGPVHTVNIAPTVNAELVNEAQQDGTTSYVYDSTVGHGDLYNIAATPSALASVVAVTTRGFIEKSDAGARSGAMQLKSGASSATTWNPADLVNTTLSGSNLVATISSAGGARSIASVTNGKWYWEETWTSGPQPGAGVANASAALGTVWATPTNAAIAYSGSIYVNNVNMGTGPSFPSAGVTVCIALDVDAKLIWFRNGAAGAWNAGGSANPATGVGGVSIAALSTPLFALAATSSSTVWTVNFGASAFTGAVPSGFAAGFGSSGGTTVQSTSTPLTSSFTWLYRTDSTDPNTSSAWTPAAVDGVQIGPVVTA